MIWVGYWLFGGRKVRFRIEFNAYTNEWVEFPSWIRERINDFLGTYGQVRLSYLKPSFYFQPSMEPEPVDETNDDSDVSPEFDRGVQNVINFQQTMLYLADQGVLSLNVTQCERTFLYEYEEMKQQSATSGTPEELLPYDDIFL